MAAEHDVDTVLSDVDEEEDLPSTVNLPAGDSPSLTPPFAAGDSRVRELAAELEEERRARREAEESKAEIQVSFNRLKALAHDVIKKREEAIKEKDLLSRAVERSSSELAESVKQRDSLRTELDSAGQMLISGIEKISGKVGAAAAGLPPSQKYTGLPAVAYGVIKRTNEIVDELSKQVETSARERDRAREQMEQRNYEIAIEVSQLEATISGLRDDTSMKAKEVEELERLLAERNAKLSDMENQISEVRLSRNEFKSKLLTLESKLDGQRPLLLDQLSHISKVYEQVHSILAIVDANSPSPVEPLDSLFMFREANLDENLRTSVEVMNSIYELTKVAGERIKERLKRVNEEVQALKDEVSGLVAEKQHISTLLRSALTSKASEVLQVAEDGLREAGIYLKLDGHQREIDHTLSEEEDEVYTLAGALENTVKTSKMKIIELENLVEALRAESSLLKAHLDAQGKELAQHKHLTKDLQEKERMANESVEGLMMDIASAEEEISRWKAAAEQEAAAGRSVEREFLSQMSALRREVEDAKQRLSEAENKLKFKEETASAAMAARDAAEKSLRLADTRATRLRERLEELSRQLEESDNRNDSRSQHSHRYICWPWQWLGMDSVRYQQITTSSAEQQQSSNEMELSEPLL